MIALPCVVILYNMWIMYMLKSNKGSNALSLLLALVMSWGSLLSRNERFRVSTTIIDISIQAHILSVTIAVRDIKLAIKSDHGQRRYHKLTLISSENQREKGKRCCLFILPNFCMHACNWWNLIGQWMRVQLQFTLSRQLTYLSIIKLAIH